MRIVNIPFKTEEFSVAARQPTANELLQIAHNVIEECEVWHEEPREWKEALPSFVGFRLGNALNLYQLDRKNFDALVALVLTHYKLGAKS